MGLFGDDPIGETEGSDVGPEPTTDKTIEPSWFEILFGWRRKQPPGWYAHPTILTRERYWDGEKWTGRSRGKGAAPVKPPGPITRFLDAEVEAQRKLEEARAKILCQFCQESGHVTVTHVKTNKRLSATRIVGTFATAGGSLLLTGVHKKGHITRLTCSNCQMSWDIRPA